MWIYLDTLTIIERKKRFRSEKLSFKTTYYHWKVILYVIFLGLNQKLQLFYTIQYYR